MRSRPLEALNSRNSLYFPCLTGNFQAESSSQQTASSATQSSPAEILRGVRQKSAHVGPNLHLSRHQRQASSSHTVRISAFYLRFEFCWCREKTGHKFSPFIVVRQRQSLINHRRVKICRSACQPAAGELKA